jgi:hypothetical protein
MNLRMKQRKWWLVLSAGLTLSLVMFFSFQWILNQRAQHAVDEVVTKFSPFAKLEYEGVSANFWTGMVHIHEVHIRPSSSPLLPIYVKELGVKAQGSTGDYITHLKLNFRHVELPVEYADSYALVRQILHYHGKAALQGDFFLDYQYAPHNQRMKALLFTQINDLGKLEIKLTSQPFDPHQYSFSDFMQFPLRKLDMIYQDDSLVEKLWAVLGAQEGKTREEYQENLAQQLDQSIENTTEIPIRHSLRALHDFIERPRYLRITLASLQPTSLQQLDVLSKANARARVDVRIVSRS